MEFKKKAAFLFKKFGFVCVCLPVSSTPVEVPVRDTGEGVRGSWAGIAGICELLA